MSIELLKRTKPNIAKEPLQFVMKSYFFVDSGIPNCHTAACIAGHTIATAREITPFEASEWCYMLNVATEAQRLLDLTDTQAFKLFYFIAWPAQFQKKPSNNVEQALARIDHFIATNGEE